MGHDTLVFAEAVFLGEVAALPGPYVGQPNSPKTGMFHQPCDGSITLCYFESQASLWQNVHSVHAPRRPRAVDSKTRPHKPHGMMTAQRATTKGLISELVKLGHSAMAVQCPVSQ